MLQHLECGISGKDFGHNAFSFIKDSARESSVRGAAFTKVDGSIKIVAEGEEADLVAFSEKIKNGGIFSEVENFYANITDPIEDFGDFYVLDN